MPAATKRAENDHAYPVRSLAKGLELLLLFRNANQPVRVNAASQQIGVSPSTAHRLIAMLKSMDLVRQDATTRAYFAGPALYSLAHDLLADSDIFHGAASEMRALAAKIGETTALCVLRGGEARFITVVRGPRATPSNAGGFTRPAHTTAAGKALLAYLAQPELRKLLSNPRFLPPEPSRRQVVRELKAIRDAGFAQSANAEFGGSDIATPIRDGNGLVYGAVCAMSIDDPVAAKRAAQIATALQQSCKRIAARLETERTHAL